MKDSAANGQPTPEREAAEQEATVQKTSLLALSRRSRRADEQSHHLESGVETAEFAVATPEAGDAERSEEAEMTEGAEKRRGFKHWRRQRPFIGGVLAILGGIELFFSGQLDLGNMQIQFGIEGLQATVIPIVIVVLALLSIFRPTHHVFYGIIGLVLAVYSLIGVNLGGFIIGMLLSTIGAILVIAWMGPRGPKESEAAEGETA
ncbi:DUF6114 domain-containing protein [Brevibacterium spongiae]|uniref:DUF6114 domain-containing protein n=1 Tax=Brevibacterium spongiae TaxID=2909672 RepID=A0ABY5STY7_9MICO|nr:DUF6114 domain-containing protein [Brevibacterium spongiae]UVI36169.1 DUF6114 domain-containing protein [Brevibacterium spongiae]